MTYAVKEIYYTLQGEGAQSGRAAMFLRFAGCNLWTGREEDRHKGKGGCSKWCDTDFVGTDGENGGKFKLPEELALRVVNLWYAKAGAGSVPYVVCTGGEPFLQLDQPLVDALNHLGAIVAVETNGTIASGVEVDWVCVSPKGGAPIRLEHGNELKLVYPQSEHDPKDFELLDFGHFFLQPKDGPDVERNTQLCVEYCMAHPWWRLSLQTHKLLKIK
jgi:7-carboxy-7-deazaguanine synthase